MPTAVLGRRSVLLGSVLATPALIGARAQGRSRVVFASWGGSWEAAMRRAWFEPFTQRTGIDVVTASGNTYGRIEAMVQARRTEWDVVEVNPDFQIIGAERNLLEPIDFNLVDRSIIMQGRGMITEFSVPQVLFSRVMFHASRFNPPPQNWAEAWDTQRFPGRRSFLSRANGGVMEAALLSDGVAPDALFPLDIDRALRRLSAIRPQLLWYETNAQGEQFMTDGQAAIGLLADGRAMNAVTNRAPSAIQFNQSLMTWSTMVVPRGAPNREAAMRLLAYALSVEGQARIAMEFTYGPVVPAAMANIPSERQLILSAGPQQQGRYVLVDETWWAGNFARVTERLNAWRLG